jgi:hypothetical protein
MELPKSIKSLKGTCIIKLLTGRENSTRDCHGHVAIPSPSIFYGAPTQRDELPQPLSSNFQLSFIHSISVLQLRSPPNLSYPKLPFCCNNIYTIHKAVQLSPTNPNPCTSGNSNNALLHHNHHQRNPPSQASLHWLARPYTAPEDNNIVLPHLLAVPTLLL